MPWVSVAMQKPPLRPEACQPMRSASRARPRGRVAFLGKQRRPEAGEAAAHDGEIALQWGLSRGGAGAGACGLSSQKGSGQASARARRAVGGSPAR